MDEDKQGRMLSPMDVVSVSGETDAVLSLIAGANTPPTPQDTVKKISLESESEAKVSLHQKSVPEYPSSSVSPQKSVTTRPADESLESLIAPHNIKTRLDASVSSSKTQPSIGSVFESKQTSPASTSTLLFSNNKDRSLTQDILSIHQPDCINLIALIKNMKHAGENALSQKSGKISCLQSPSQMKVGRWDSEERKVAVTPILPSAPSVASMEDQLVGYVAPPEELVPYSVSPNDTREKQPGKKVHSHSMDKNESQVTSSLGVAGNIPGPITRPQSVEETDSTAVCQRPLNYAEVSGGHQLVRCLSAPASGHYGWYNQAVSDTRRKVSSSVEAVNATPGSNTSGAFHVHQEVQQHQMQQQILQLLHQQQILQQQLQYQMQQQIHQFQMQQPQMYQVHQYQKYQQQSNQEIVQQQHQMQPLIHQYQVYPHQMQQRIHPNTTYQQQHYSQYCTGTSMAPKKSNLPLPADANVEYSIHRISPAQHENLVMQNISPSSHEEHYPSPSTTPSIPAANQQDISQMPFYGNHQH